MVMLEQHIEDIKKDKYLMSSVTHYHYPLNHMVVLGTNSKQYWIQAPHLLNDYETEICTVEELIEWLSRH